MSTFESLSERDYRLLWAGQISTSMGQWMDQVTRGWLIYQITGSATQLGLATAARGLPLLLFGVIAGALADRSGRKIQLVDPLKTLGEHQVPVKLHRDVTATVKVTVVAAE